MGFKVSEFYGPSGNFLDGTALGGQARTVVITGAGEHVFDGDNGPEKTLYITATTEDGAKLPKPIKLTPTRARQVAQDLGDDTDAWQGKRIVIQPAPWEMNGRTGWYIAYAGLPPTGAPTAGDIWRSQQSEAAPQPQPPTEDPELKDDDIPW